MNVTTYILKTIKNVLINIGIKREFGGFLIFVVYY